MAQITIEDLPILEELTREEMQSLVGGFRRRPRGGPGNEQPPPEPTPPETPPEPPILKVGT